MGWWEIVPMEECSFLAVEKPQRMRLSAEQVALNFGARSPWSPMHILFRQDSAHLYLWFAKGQATNSHKIQIPEGYLLAKPFLNHSESILVSERKQGDIYTVIHKGRLAAQMISALATNTEQNVAENISLLEKEFSMGHAEIIHVPENSTPSPSWKDLWEFSGIRADRALLLKAWKWAETGMIAILTMAAIFSLFNNMYLQHLVAQKEQQLQKMLQQSSSYRQRMLDIMQKSAFWRQFLTTESESATWLQMMNALAESFAAQNGYLKSVHFSGREVLVEAGVKGTAPALVRQLLASGFFSESKIISTTGDPQDPDIDLVNIRLVIQPALEVTDG
jgi:hypothetical protein